MCHRNEIIKSMSNSLCGFYEINNIQLTFFLKEDHFFTECESRPIQTMCNYKSMAFLFNSVMVEFIREDFLTSI